MNKRALKSAARTKERFKHIMSLRNSNDFNKIYELYGQKIYNLAVPSSYKEKDIEMLINQGRFGDIYRKYGEDAYNKNIYRLQEVYTYFETGSKTKANLVSIKNRFFHKIAPIFLAISICFPFGLAIGVTRNLKLDMNSIKNSNAIKYQEQLIDYNKYIKEYASIVNSMDLSDLQIFMKVMSDISLNYHYEELGNTVDDIGYWRLSLYKEGYGVCRHFADDCTAKLNAINPDYNARNIIVHSSPTRQDTNSEFDSANILGNHMVTAVDVPEKNITLILDPTSNCIGVFDNGNIPVLNNLAYTMEPKIISEFLFSSTADAASLILDSFLPCNYSMSELQLWYGPEAQKNAVLELHQKEANQNNFINRIKIKNKTPNVGNSDLPIIENSAKNSKELSR